MTTLVDTSVFVDALRSHRPALSFLRDLPEVPFASEVTRIELMQGVRSSERAVLESLMAAIIWVAVDEVVARHAGLLGREYRRSHAHLGVADLVIAATALEAGANLATLNLGHFPMFPDLERPY